jgi:hypothetical protein
MTAAGDFAAFDSGYSSFPSYEARNEVAQWAGRIQTIVILA